jgi:hypothetical protein
MHPSSPDRILMGRVECIPLFLVNSLVSLRLVLKLSISRGITTSHFIITANLYYAIVFETIL